MREGRGFQMYKLDCMVLRCIAMYCDVLRCIAMYCCIAEVRRSEVERFRLDETFPALSILWNSNVTWGVSNVGRCQASQTCCSSTSGCRPAECFVVVSSSSAMANRKLWGPGSDTAGQVAVLVAARGLSSVRESPHSFPTMPGWVTNRTEAILQHPSMSKDLYSSFVVFSEATPNKPVA